MVNALSERCDCVNIELLSVHKRGYMRPGIHQALRCGIWLFLLGGALGATVQAAEQQRVYSVVVPIQHPRPYPNYYLTLLKMALEESKLPGERIQIEEKSANYSQARWIYELQFQSKDQPPLVFWTVATPEREALVQPIRIPILKGLLGKRVFLIREEEQARFDRVKTLDDLARLRAGQDRHWPDTDILRANGLPVTTTSNMDLLYKMLRGRRFDYFPRGFTEAWHELETRSAEGLMVEQRLMLSYPFALYFFVNKDHQDLARRIETGLESLIADGRFDQYFFNHPRIKKALREIQSQPRRVFYLENPQLPPETPLRESHLWYQLPFEVEE